LRLIFSIFKGFLSVRPIISGTVYCSRFTPWRFDVALLQFVRGARRSSAALLIVPLVALTIAAVGLRPTVAGNSFPIITQISQDVFKNHSSQHHTEVEPGSFAFGSTIVSSFQEGRFDFNGGASDIGWATSSDSGKHWKYGTLPGLTKLRSGGIYDRASDTTVAYDAKHGVWLIESLPILLSGGARPAMLISRSTDGLSWQLPVSVGPNLGDSDKTWVTCDDWSASPFYGHCYAEWDSLSTGLVNMSTSTDGGATWGPALNSADGSLGQGGVPQVQPNGTVVVPFYGFSVGAMGAFRSTNGGSSWTTTSTIAPIATHAVAGGLRALLLPGSGMDGAGKVFVVWMDCSFRPNCASNDIVMSSSSDGKTWSAAVPIPIDPTNSTVDHFIPGFAIDTATKGNTAHLALTYYYYPNTNCSPVNCELNVGFIDSHDGGTTWSAPVAVDGPINLAWLPATSLGPMTGDYIATSISNGRAFGIFATADPPFQGTFDEAMFTVTGGVAYSPYGVHRTQFGLPRVTFHSDHPTRFRPVPTD
jgi:hypothetical protein